MICEQLVPLCGLVVVFVLASHVVHFLWSLNMTQNASYPTFLDLLGVVAPFRDFCYLVVFDLYSGLRSVVCTGRLFCILGDFRTGLNLSIATLFVCSLR